jgi:glucose/arabinose dehydrogenase
MCKDPVTMRHIYLILTLFAVSCCRAYGDDQIIQTQLGRVLVKTVVSGLEHPWGLDFMPTGDAVLSERPGRLRIVTPHGIASAPLAGVPKVFATGQGGLLDVALAPDFSTSREVYLSFAEPGSKGQAGTAVMRARLLKRRLANRKVIFRQFPKLAGPNHFGSRIVFAADGSLFITLADRFRFMRAQRLVNHQGKLVRINRDGTVPGNNPWVNRPAARPEIWSHGHRNVQGAALHPQTGELWISEFGPQGGDEVNIARRGANYGWPLVSWGKHYTGELIPPPTARPDLSDAVYHWTPSISPSGIAFYTGDTFPAWRGNLLLGALSAKSLVRLTLQGNTVISEERIDLGRRIRHVRQGPDGAVYLLTDEDNGELLRLTPAP